MKKKLNDKDIIDTVEKCVSQSVGFNDNKLSQERIDVHRYYYAEWPGVNAKGKSKFISQDVFDSVESMKSCLLETFAAGSEIGMFAPHSAEDVVHCRLATTYCDWVVFEQNNGFNVFSDMIHNGLTARMGVAKVRWEKSFDEGEEEFDKVTEEALAQILQDEYVELKEITQNTAPDGVTPLYSGSIARRCDHSQTRVTVVPPESFFIEAGAEDMMKAFCGDWQRMTESELLGRGISKAKIEEIGVNGREAWQTDQELAMRHDETGNTTATQQEKIDGNVKRVVVKEVYVDLDVEGTGTSKLWRVLYAGSTLLEKETVKRRPYVVFVPLPIPHKVTGDSYAKRIFPTQNANTMLMRGILDHTAITNNPRMTVLKGTINDARELIDNRYGGLVNINRPDGLKPLEQASLNPFVFQTLQLLDYKNEGTSAVSKLSQGLNKDAVSKQNSAAMVEQITSMSMQRQKIIARRFANDVVKRLYELVYDVVLENEKRAHITQIAGEWVEARPGEWPPGSRSFRVELAVGYGEKDRQASEWLQLHQLLSSDPGMTAQYTSEERYNIMQRVFEAKGKKDISSYVRPPDKAQPPSPPAPDPLETAKLEIRKMELEIMKMEVQAKLEAAKIKQQSDTTKSNVALMKVEGDHAVKADAQDLREKEFAHKQKMDAEELSIMKSAAEVKAIAAVNG